MSIQSEINRLNTAVSTQADLLAQVKTALEGKGSGGGGGGGGSGETCTVNIEFDASYGNVYALTYATSAGVQGIGAAGSNRSYALQNVLCGSCISFIYSPVYGCSVATDNATLVTKYNNNPLGLIGHYLVFQTPATSGTATITITDED